MPLITGDDTLAIYIVPKVACTLVKNLVYFIDYGKKFKPSAKVANVHELYETHDFVLSDRFDPCQYTRVALVRDPVERLLSAYVNRVVHKGLVLEESFRTTKNDLVAQPTPDLFFCSLDRYRLASSDVRHHTESICNFLGPDPNFFDNLIAIENIEDFISILERVSGVSLAAFRDTGSLIRFNSSYQRLTLEDLSQEARRALVRYAMPDYAFLKGKYLCPNDS